MKADGKIERYKARLEAQGFSQRFGSDYDETFSPVVRLESVCTLIGLSVHYQLQLHQLDVTTAFLNGQLKEEVYMTQPEGFVQLGKEHLVCRLRKSIYGLKQSPRCWNTALDAHLKQLGFVQTESDLCIYCAPGEPCLLGVYVDIVLAAKATIKIHEVKQGVEQKFAIKDMGRLHNFLGIKVVHNDKTGRVWIGQPGYTHRLLKRFKMEEAKPVAAPVDTSTKLIDVECNNFPVPCEFQSAVGGLLFLAHATRPDISLAVSDVAKFSAHPLQQHWIAVTRCYGRYLRGTTCFGLAFTPQETD